MRSKDGESPTFLHSKEGVTQGDPLSMVIYGVGMLPLTTKLQEEVPSCIQPWYADDAGAGGKLDGILSYFTKLCEDGPARGYFPETTKSILVVKP